MKSKHLLFFCLSYCIVISQAFAQVPNDACLTAEQFPLLQNNIETCVQGTTIGANAELPYINQVSCLADIAQPTPASDVWYQFESVANFIEIYIQSDMDNIAVALYEGYDCEYLVGRDCAVNNNGGNLTVTFSPLAAGTTYYLQISGGSVGDMGDFSLCVRNYQDLETICMLNQTISLDPLPINGAYTPGQAVTICLNIGGYTQDASDWLHGIVPVFGNGWDLSSIDALPPQSCDANGEWGWYELVQSAGSPNDPGPQGPGFFYDSPANSPTGDLDGNPGNNYGDNNPGVCDWVFCLQLLTASECSGDAQSGDLSIEFLNFSDSETGNWNATASDCPNDPNFKFKAVLQCCAPPTLSSIDPSCAHPNGGSITATGVGNPPFVFTWSNGFTETGSTSTISNLPAGFYSVITTDIDNCQAGTSITLEETTAGSEITIPISVQGCGGCLASPFDPIAVSLLNSAGETINTFTIVACPTNIITCVPADDTYSLAYNGLVIENVIVNGQVTGNTPFAFNLGEPSSAGSLPTELQIICSGDMVNVTTSGTQLDGNAVLVYALHTSPTLTENNILATGQQGSFAYNGNWQYNTVYYVSAVAGLLPVGGSIPDLESPCTGVSNSTPVVFLAPIVFEINEHCDFITGVYSVTASISGGLPSFDSNASYMVIGDYQAQLSANESFSTSFEEGQTDQYYFMASDGLCDNGSASRTFYCEKTPVELGSFSGKAMPEGNLLQWFTYTEIQSSHFALERSTDGIVFLPIGRNITAAGNSTTPHYYTYTDREAPEGKSYYRLIQTDLDGKQQNLGVVVIERKTDSSFEFVQVGAGNSVSINVQWQNPTATSVRINVYDIAGKNTYSYTVEAQKGLNTTILPTSAFSSSGIYLITLNNGNEQIVTKFMQR